MRPAIAEDTHQIAMEFDVHQRIAAVSCPDVDIGEAVAYGDAIYAIENGSIHAMLRRVVVLPARGTVHGVLFLDAESADGPG